MSNRAVSSSSRHAKSCTIWHAAIAMSAWMMRSISRHGKRHAKLADTAMSRFPNETEGFCGMGGGGFVAGDPLAMAAAEGCCRCRHVGNESFLMKNVDK